MFLATLDFVECCFKNRARAGRGRGRLGCFTVTPDGASGLCWWAESTEGFWDPAGAELSVLTLSLQFSEFKMSLTSLTFLFVTTVSSFSAGDVSLRVRIDTLSLLGTSCTLLFGAMVLVLVRSARWEVLLLMPSCSRLHRCSET